MNLKMVFRVIGRLLVLEACILLLPLTVAALYNESTGVVSFAIVSAFSLVLGILLSIIFRTKNKIIYAREGFAITAFAWLFMSAVGALPFYISGEIPSYINAFFESVSGFTTTGASILQDVEQMSRGMLFWRSFTHWLGGMGVLVFIMAITPNLSDRSIHIMRAEVSGPVVGKLLPRIKDTAKILYLIYVGLTLVEVVFLLFGQMNLYDSFIYAFGTAGTGGFGIKSDSIGSYSPYIQWVIAIFMTIFGINFNIYYILLVRKIKPIFKSTETKAYLLIIAISTIAIATNTGHMFNSFSDTIRHAFFQVSSIITTTGFSTTDFNMWPVFSKAVILLLIFCGGCAGSTAGGLKVSRVVLLAKMCKRELQKMLHPRSIKTIKIEDKRVDEATLSACSTYFSIYMACILALFLVLGCDSFGDIETNFTAAVTCFNNVGPGFAKIGPMSNFYGYNDFSTIVLSFAMLMGRLEIFPLLLLFSPSMWKKN